MSNATCLVRSLRLLAALSVGAVCAALAPTAHAGPYQVYGTHFAWDNNFNNSTINTTFGTGSTPSMTVSYNFPSGNLYGYPACIRGWHYGWNPANDNLFPMQVSAASTIPCNFSYSQSGTSMSGDFAYDMFLRTDNAKSTPQLEVMVWAGNNSWPIGTVTASNVLTTGGYTFDLWEGMNSAAGYYVYTFIPHGTAGSATLPTSGSLNVDMKTFFNWLQANRSSSGHYSNSMYLDVVEAGIEITGGNGSAHLAATINATTGSSGGTIANGTYRLLNRASGKYLDNLGSTANGAGVGQWTGGTSNNQKWQVTNQGNGYYKLVCVTGSMRLDSLGHTGNGSTVGQWSDSTSYNQQWTIQSLGGGYYKVINRGNGLCLDTGGNTTNGSIMQFWSSGSSYNQQWQFGP